MAWLQSLGSLVTYEASVSRLYGAELVQRIVGTGMSIIGLYGQLAPASEGAHLAGVLEREHLHCLALTIAAGTTEIQRSIIATRGFGLPR